MDQEVRRAHTASKGVYGVPRVEAQLARDGTPANLKTVATSLRRQGLAGISPRRFTPVTTLPGIPTTIIPDQVQRSWDTGSLDAVWMSDITSLRTGEGCLYLCVIRDGWSRRGNDIAPDNRSGGTSAADGMDTPPTNDRANGAAHRSWQSIHVHVDSLGDRRAVDHPIHGANRCVLGQRDGRILLVDFEGGVS